MIEFTIPGEPKAQGRPRSGKTFQGKPIMYDPKDSRYYKKYVAIVAQQHAPEKPLEGPLNVLIKVYRPIPKSMTKKLRQASMAGLHRPITKPDNSNYAKGIEDALNNVIYNDDSQIVDLVIRKFYSDKPRVEIRIEEVGAVDE